jgi:hypothetical protein
MREFQYFDTDLNLTKHLAGNAMRIVINKSSGRPPSFFIVSATFICLTLSGNFNYYSKTACGVCKVCAAIWWCLLIRIKGFVKQRESLILFFGFLVWWRRLIDGEKVLSLIVFCSVFLVFFMLMESLVSRIEKTRTKM